MAPVFHPFSPTGFNISTRSEDTASTDTKFTKGDVTGYAGLGFFLAIVVFLPGHLLLKDAGLLNKLPQKIQIPFIQCLVYLPCLLIFTILFWVTVAMGVTLALLLGILHILLLLFCGRGIINCNTAGETPSKVGSRESEIPSSSTADRSGEANVPGDNAPCPDPQHMDVPTVPPPPRTLLDKACCIRTPAWLQATHIVYSDMKGLFFRRWSLIQSISTKGNRMDIDLLPIRIPGNGLYGS